MNEMQKVTLSSVRQMQLELDKLEAQAQQEVKVRKTRSLGLLRMDMVAECRRRLLYISVAIKQSPKKINQKVRILAARNVR